jgi:hypothetical protein
MADPVDEDIRHDDLEFDPQLEPKKAQAWLNLLLESEKAFESWNDHCDKLEKQYASLERLANYARDREFQMFWANAEVIKPAIYAKPPVPVVVTRFKDRRPVYQAAAELLERCCITAFDLAYINDVMIQIRDDVALIGRGVPWCRYESANGDGYYDTEKVCIDYKHRRDFLHSVSRCWYEVWWVAAASYLTREQARDRFRKHSGNAYREADYKVDRDAKEVGGADNRERARFWEIWDKKNRRVVWVAEGCENILDEDKAHLELRDFFPCPKPAYGTLQRGSLVPVPDVLQYADQLKELNLLTARIHALSDALEAKGFYPAGGSELGDAIEAALKHQTPGRVMVPISNWAQFGGSKEVIIWLPIAEIAQTVTALVALRKEIIQDIYQIMGLSDIMRGASDARETLGAQQLKTQYGSSRIRDKQYELVRIAKDLVGIVAEIIAEKFDEVTIIQMSQTQLPTEEMKQMQLAQLTQQVGQQQQALQMMQQLPQVQQMAQQNPDQMQQMMQQGQSLIAEGQKAIAKIQGKPTFEQVVHFLKDNRARTFVLDIETDSTIQIDENAEKQRRAEYTGMLAQLLPQLTQLVMAVPETVDFAGEVLKFSVAPFRAGRSLDGSIDEMVETMKAKGGQPKPDDPATMQAKTTKEIEAMKISYQKEKDQGEMALHAAELKQKDDHAKLKIQSDQAIEAAKLQSQQQQDAGKAQQINLKAMADREKHQADMIKADADGQGAQQKVELAQQMAALKQNDMAARAAERQAMQQYKMTQQPRGF